MSQTEIPVLCVTWTGWKDEDFYKLKLVCDRVDRIGFLFYLFHPKQALRDLRLWFRFRHTIKQVSKPKNVKTWFKTGKKKKDLKPEIKSNFDDITAIEKKIDEIIDKNENKS